MRIDLRSLLVEYSDPGSSVIHEAQITDCTKSILQLRDSLYVIGKILYEDLENKVYVCSVSTGIGNQNNAIIALQMQGSIINCVGFAKEGLISQNCWTTALKKLKDIAQGRPQPKQKRWTRFLFMAVILFLVVMTIGGIFTSHVHKIIDATKDYNDAVESFNISAENYNEAVQQASVDNIEGLPSFIELLHIESTSFFNAAGVIFSSNNSDKIQADAVTVKQLKDQVDQICEIVQQITAPSKEWVEERLKTVQGISEMQAVTEELDPDKLLGREGGYSACIYYSLSDIKQDEIPGENIVTKGADCGGAVEIYPTLADAEARCNYLSGFDGTVLYSGSYALVGTMVIRTSYKLTDQQQLHYTDEIIKAFSA